MNALPTTVVADQSGHIIDWPEIKAAGRSGRLIIPIAPGLLIPLPEGSTLYLLPHRRAIGFGNAGMQESGKKYSAVAAFLPPGYVALSLAAYKSEKNAPPLPLFCYCAICWYKGKFHVPAIRIDHDPKHDPACFDMKKVNMEINRWLRKHPKNRLVSHHGLNCVRKYGCPNAANLFLKRWEAPIAVSNACNAACKGCISKQKSGSVQASQERIDFIPTVDEIVEIAVPHLEKAPRAMISFGQGCEGEPLLRGELIESAIREIRRKTRRGTIHINTNGSFPEIVKRLAHAGLDSIRISLNSSQHDLYSAYYRCRNYSFDDVLRTFSVAQKAGLWISVNYLTFPGTTDDITEVTSFKKLIHKYKPHMIQWRNLNIDPEWYINTTEQACTGTSATPIGLDVLISQIRKQFPKIRHGYFNPPVRHL